MRVTLDLGKLLHDGTITQAEHDRLLALAARDTGSLGINILVGAGVVAVSLGAVALVPTAWTAIAIGGVLSAAGALAGRAPWTLLGDICLAVGALMLAGGILWLDNGSAGAFLAVTVLLAGIGLLARSALVVVLAVLALASAVGGSFGYGRATYVLAVEQPTLTILVFGVLAAGLERAARRLAPALARLATAAARTAVFLVNFGFWVGSLWGDTPFAPQGARSLAASARWIAPGAFALAWAIVLLAAGVWGARTNRRWVVNVAAVFGAIDFYTQWFERLGATPGTVLLGGLALLAFALGLWRWNTARAGA